MRTNKWMETTHVCAFSDKRSHHTLVLITTTYEKQQRAGNICAFSDKRFLSYSCHHHHQMRTNKGKEITHICAFSPFSLVSVPVEKNDKYEVWSREPTKGWKPHTIVHSRTKGALSSFIGFSSILHGCKLLTSITSNF